MIDAIQNVYRHAKLAIVLSVIVSLLGGGFNALLVSQVSAVADERIQLNSHFLVRFMVIVVLTFATSLSAQLISLHLTVSYETKLRVQMCRTIINTPLRKLEEIGSHRLLAALTLDSGWVSRAADQIPQLCLNLAAVVSCLAYLAFTSFPLFLGLLVLLPISVISYHIPERRLVAYSTKERDSWDEVVQCFEKVTRGVKELKLNRDRRTDMFLNQLVPAVKANQHFGTVGTSIYIAITNWGNLLCFVVIGLVFAVVPHLAVISKSSLITCALVTLYLRAPILGVLQAARELSRASVALQKLRTLGIPWDQVADQPATPASPPTSWETIELVEITHEYFVDTDDHWFVLGPISLLLRPGSLIFVTGGNGSGKTTLVKLVTGLYAPQKGVIKLNGNVVDNDNLDDYRQYFSAVFFDFELFERILALDSQETKDKVDRYLHLLQLTHKVRTLNGKFSNTKLSAGQRRRLALLQSFMEDRPVHIFDEWAADQDQAFKDIFYRQLLPQLKAQGKAVVVVTHDERYFDLADSVVRLENGRIVTDSSTRELFDESPRVTRAMIT